MTGLLFASFLGKRNGFGFFVGNAGGKGGVDRVEAEVAAGVNGGALVTGED